MFNELLVAVLAAPAGKEMAELETHRQPQLQTGHRHGCEEQLRRKRWYADSVKTLTAAGLTLIDPQSRSSSDRVTAIQ